MRSSVQEHVNGLSSAGQSPKTRRHYAISAPLMQDASPRRALQVNEMRETAGAPHSRQAIRRTDSLAIYPCTTCLPPKLTCAAARFSDDRRRHAPYGVRRSSAKTGP